MCFGLQAAFFHLLGNLALSLSCLPIFKLKTTKVSCERGVCCCTYTEQPGKFSFLHTVHVALASGHILGPVPELLAKTPFSPGQLSNPPVTPPKILCEDGCGAILNIAMTSMSDQPSLHPWAVACYFSAGLNSSSLHCLSSHLTTYNISGGGEGGYAQMLHPALACDLASWRIFLSLNCLPTSFYNPLGS